MRGLHYLPHQLQVYYCNNPFWWDAELDELYPDCNELKLADPTATDSDVGRLFVPNWELLSLPETSMEASRIDLFLNRTTELT